MSNTQLQLWTLNNLCFTASQFHPRKILLMCVSFFFFFFISLSFLPLSDPPHSEASSEPFPAAHHGSYNPKCHSSLLSRWTRLRRSEVTAPCDPEMIRRQKLSGSSRTKKTIKTPQFYHVSQYPLPYEGNWHLFLLLPCVLQDAVFKNAAIGKQNVAITRGRLHYK